MIRRFYPAKVTGFSREIRNGLEEVSQGTGDISLLGGWAVHGLVQPEHAMESQDIDIVLHSREAWEEAIRYLKGEDFEWRRYGRDGGRGQRDKRLVHPDYENLAVDIFYTKTVGIEFLQRLFGTAWAGNIKNFEFQGFVPALEVILDDKLQILPRRREDDKMLKDAVDIHAMLYHNLRGTSPKMLLQGERQLKIPRVLPHLESLPTSGTYGPQVKDLIALLNRFDPRGG